MLTSSDLLFVGVGAAGIFAAHSVESRVQGQDIPIEHMSRIAVYWSIGMIAYFMILRGGNNGY
tara:strand:+ start:285 stop:473 length:189 start_codon:yes stop_codon:yes gene_type:complete